MKKLLLVIVVIMIFFSVSRLFLKDETIDTVVGAELPTIDSGENFEKLIKEMAKQQQSFLKFRMGFGVEEKAMEATDSAAASGDHSTTNVQVDGVDEADRVKNDGQFIYQLRDYELTITKATPADAMKVVYSERFDFHQFYPREMYVDEQFLVLIGGRSAYDQKEDVYKEYTKMFIYELNDRHDLAVVREAEVEGYYLSSRKMNNSLYIVTNKHLPYYLFNEVRDKEEWIETMRPTYADTALADEPKKIGWDEIRYFPGSTDTNYLIVSGLDLGNLDEPISVNAFLGAGQTIYANHEHLYVTRAYYEHNESAMEKIANLIWNPFTDQDTKIYKFKLNQGAVSFLAEGKVEGALLNQFSMDEHNGYFRVATTKGDVWSDENPSENLLFILDEKLQQVGSITGIAHGERIYSARFMGDRGYIVTFKAVDPLFVLDLKDPKNPKILGELKIPGFSDYLHPYDEHHIIGFGKDTIENGMGGAIPLGFKMALFDITDVTNPKEKFVEIIGESWTQSELLYNHKALLFSKEKNIIAFPIEVYEQKGNSRDMYPSFVFQGAYVYGLDVEKGFEIKKRITHYDTEVIPENYWDYEKHISRLLYIGDHLYTISNEKIVAHEMTSFEKAGQLLLGK